jgi:hypothetical protein
MMSRRSKRQNAGELRSRFLANREKVRSWVSGWHCPEIAWPEVPLVPFPGVREGDEERWLEHAAPTMPEYRWLLEARPLSEGVTHVRGIWWFTEGHEFERLEILTRTYADAGYLAETLTRGVHAAALKGWTEADARPVHEWLLEGLDSRPMEEAVRGTQRMGFVLLKLARFPYSRTEIDVRLEVTVTNTALDGSPLDATGEPVRR